MGLMAELEERFCEVMPAAVSQYLAATLGGQSHREGLAAWQAVRFWPYVLTDVEEVSTRTTVLGTGIATPVLVAR